MSDLSPPLATAALPDYLASLNSAQRDAALHGCGPGNTLRVIRATLGAARVRPFLSAAQFRAELLA